ncbi:MAG TPA: histidine kinase dimerization/phosphoacceptor domain -containing protein [Rectinemataceae bacterium]|nr:histidine kinase dimerization/phosphoacceptor domain -containing protein [Rectinemataceae bacterium]
MPRSGLGRFVSWLFGVGGMKRTILIPYVCLIVTGFGAGGFLYLQGSRSAVLGAVDLLLAESAARVSDRLEEFLAGSVALAEANASQVAEIPDSSAGLQRLRRLFFRELQERDDVDLASVGYADGRYVEAQRVTGGAIHVGEADASAGRSLLLQSADSHGDPLAVLQERPGYDPRTRPWYLKAAEAERTAWTEPYPIVSSNELSMTAVSPIYRDGRLAAVTTANVTLGRLSTYLAKMETSRSGIAAIADKGGRLLASSDFSSLVDQGGLRRMAGDGEGVAALTFREAAKRAPGSPFSLNDGQLRYRAVARDWSGPWGLSWRVVVALPESMFYAPLEAIDHRALVILVVMLALVLVIAFFAAGRVSGPLRELGKAISMLEPDSPSLHPAFPSDTGVERARLIAHRSDEIGQLASTFVMMSGRLTDGIKVLKASLAEKEILLKEVHHRVKNNLQIVSSILSLQAGLSEDEAFRESIEYMQDRIQAMAFVHEDLYRSGDFRAVGMAAYLGRVCDSLALADHLGKATRIIVEADGIELPLERALPCGLLVNELVTNALKHAFAGKPSGRVRVSLSRSGDMYILVVSDDGVGMSQSSNRLGEAGREGLGSQLVPGLADQLKGRLEIETGQEGTTARISFPV